LPNNPTITQPVERNQFSEANKQLIILEQNTIKIFFFKSYKGVLETKYTLNLGQLLRVIIDIKRYIFNLVPSKPTLSKPTVAVVAIDHQMAIIKIQVGKNFIEDVLLHGGF